MNVGVCLYRYWDGRIIADVLDMNDMLPFDFFLSTFLRSQYGTYNSMEAAAYSLLFSIQHFERSGIDIIERVGTGKFFTQDEYEEFISICKFTKKKVLELSVKNVRSFESLSTKQNDNLIYATSQSQGLVGEGTNKGRLLYFKHYICYLYKLHHGAVQVPFEVKERFEDFEKTMSDDIKKIKKTNKTTIDPFEQAIPTDKYFEILEVVQPSNELNPFTPSSRLRNQLIIQILNETPIRIGALCKLKISDLRGDNGAPRFHVTRTQNDINDSRPRVACQKTNEHISSLSDVTFKKLMLYIETDREQYYDAKKHDFIFVSSKGTCGKPIAMASVRSMLKVLSGAIGFHLHCHLFRYKWQEIFEVQAVEMGYTFEQINDMRTQASGWVEGSIMNKKYNEFRNAVLVGELNKIRQSEFVPNMDEHKKQKNTTKGSK